MTIRQDIKDALKTGQKSLGQLHKLTGHSIESLVNACGYLQTDDILRKVRGKYGTESAVYELVPVRTVTHHGNVLKSPEWVPPKPIHRPTYEAAPGVVVREYITGRVLA